ncbi:hypothetical protein FRC01_013572 [Tulasnella sp. 417]|nr:hypothetical protein FRC01_013572 [Tulasnella sp. 417]
MWRRVSRKWKNVIDNCPSLWSSIHTKKGTKHVRTVLEKSKGAPIDLLIEWSSRADDDDWIRLLAENVRRWRSIWFDHYFNELVAQLGSSPLMMDELIIHGASIPHDCKLFNPIRPNLRRLDLVAVTILHDFDPMLGLEELRLSGIREQREDGTIDESPISKIHQLLQANPNLRTLKIDHIPSSRNEHSLQSVDLPKLEEVAMFGSQVLPLFRAEHCRAVRFTVRSITETPPSSAWTTLAHTLKRVKRFEIRVDDTELWFGDGDGSYEVNVLLGVITPIHEERKDLIYSLLKDILDEAEKDAQISAHVDLALFATWESGGASDLNLEVLELLQTPASHSSSRNAYWRIPNLNVIIILESVMPYNRLRAFIQARSNSDGIQPASPVTSILSRSSKWDYKKGFKEVLDKVMSCTG